MKDKISENSFCKHLFKKKGCVNQSQVIIWTSRIDPVLAITRCVNWYQLARLVRCIGTSRPHMSEREAAKARVSAKRGRSRRDDWPGL